MPTIRILKKNDPDNYITIESYVNDSGILCTEFDPGNISATFNKVKGVGQKGSTLLATTLEERAMHISAAILGPSRDIVEKIKRLVDDVFNPLESLIMKYDDDENNIYKQIECSIDDTPNYSTDYQTNNSCMLAFKIDCTAFSPFWVDQDDIECYIQTWEGGLEFELELVSGGIVFATKGANSVTLNNSGNVDTFIEVYFNGPALNSVISLGNKFIKVNRTLTEDETLYINTSFDNKAVEVIKGETRERAYHYIDIDSTFFELSSGDNVISYATEGSFLPQSVIVKYKNQYFGL